MKQAYCDRCRKRIVEKAIYFKVRGVTLRLCETCVEKCKKEENK